MKEFVEHKRDEILQKWEKTSNDVITSFVRVSDIVESQSSNESSCYPILVRCLAAAATTGT